MAHHVEYVIDGDRAHGAGRAVAAPRARRRARPRRTRQVLDVRLLARSGERQVARDRRRPACRRRRRPRRRRGLDTSSRRHRSRGCRPPRFADHDADLAGSGPVCPLPGTVIAVHVAAGDACRRRHGADGDRGDEDGAHDHRPRRRGGDRGPVRRRRSGRHRRPARGARSTARSDDEATGGRLRSASPTARGSSATACRRAREMVEGGPIDVLTGDWLAELTMLILSRIRAKRPGGGFAGTFVTQMEQVMGTCLDRGIKVVSNAGGLDPDGLRRGRRRGGRSARPGADDRVRRRRRSAAARRRARRGGRAAAVRARRADLGDVVAAFVTANAYLGCWGIVEALRARRRHRDHRPRHRRGADVRAGGVAPRLGARRLGRPGRRGRRRPRDRVLRAGDRRQLLVLHRGARASSGSASRGPRSRRRLVRDRQARRHRRRGVDRHGDVAAAVRDRRDPRYLGPDVTARFDTIRLEQVGRRSRAHLRRPRRAAAADAEGGDERARRLPQRPRRRAHRTRHRGQGGRRRGRVLAGVPVSARTTSRRCAPASIRTEHADPDTQRGGDRAVAASRSRTPTSARSAAPSRTR